MGSPSEIKRLKKFLKHAPSGPETILALQARLNIQRIAPTSDPMIEQVWKGYDRVRRKLKEPFSILDCGCLCGYFFSYLSKSFTSFSYTGVDKWPEAIEVATRNFPEASFVCGDFMDITHEVHDYVLLSNLPASGKWYDYATARLLKYARRSVILIYPNSEVVVIGSQGTGDILRVKENAG